MAFGNGCEPEVDWSLCEEDTGYPSALPLVYVVSAVLYGLTGVLYVVSGVRTLKTQLKEKKKLSFNTAMQMHVGIVTFSASGFTHAVSLVSQEPRLPALPLLLLLHLRYICVGYVTTVLVRHWAMLYQQMGRSQNAQGQLTERMERFAKMYREGEVIQAVLTCSFFFGTVIYGVNNQGFWHEVDRLQHLVWAIFCGGTGWLVTFLGNRVHANMKSVARSSVVLDYLRRVKYVVIGSSILWCQCTGCFAVGAILGRPLPLKIWATLHGGMDLTSAGTGLLYYMVIGSKIADKAATAATLEALPAEKVKKVQQKLQAWANIVSSGAKEIIEGGVNSITSMAETSARVHVGIDSDDGEAGLRPRLATNGRRWSLWGRGDPSIEPSRTYSMAGGSPGQPSTTTTAGGGVKATAATAAAAAGAGAAEGVAGYSPGRGGGRNLCRTMSLSLERVSCSETKDGADEEVGSFNELIFDGRGGDGGGRGEKQQMEQESGGGVWETPVSPMDDNDYDDDDSREGSSGRQKNQHGSKEMVVGSTPGGRHRKLSSFSRACRVSSHGTSTSSSTASGEPSEEAEETWRVDDVEEDSFGSSSFDGSSRGDGGRDAVGRRKHQSYDEEAENLHHSYRSDRSHSSSHRSDRSSSRYCSRSSSRSVSYSYQSSGR